jgi:hypothetical protein
MPRNDDAGRCNGDYYCDARGQLCGARCLEVMLMKANKHAFLSFVGGQYGRRQLDRKCPARGCPSGEQMGLLGLGGDSGWRFKSTEHVEIMVAFVSSMT